MVPDRRRPWLPLSPRWRAHSCLDALGVPVLAGLPLGHIEELAAVPLGTHAVLDVDDAAPTIAMAVCPLTLVRQRQCGVISGLNLPATITSRANDLLLRRATAADLHPIIRLLSDDPISAGRGDVASTADEVAYAEALQRIIDDPNNDVLVVENEHAAVIGTLQLTVIPGMARRGSARLLVEAVRVAGPQRSSGVGTTLMRWVVEQAAIELKTPLVQLTSDAARTDAHRFYRRLGFIDSHVGFKIAVSLPDGPAR
jgi:GNAT superfamily N-acetyltransferase